MAAKDFREDEVLFVEWLSGRFSSDILAEIFLSLHEIEKYAMQAEIISCSLYEKLDIETIEKLWVAIEADDGFKRKHIEQLSDYSRSLNALLDYVSETTGKNRSYTGQFLPPRQAEIVEQQPIAKPEKEHVVQAESTQTSSKLDPAVENLLSGDHLEPLRNALASDGITSLDKFLDIDLFSFMNKKGLYPTTRCRAIVSSLRVKIEAARNRREVETTIGQNPSSDDENSMGPMTAKVAPVEDEEKPFVLRTSFGEFSGNSPSLAYAEFCGAIASVYRVRFRSLTGMRPEGFKRVPLYVVRGSDDIKINNTNIYVSSSLSGEEASQYAAWICESCGVEESREITEDHSSQTTLSVPEKSEKDKALSSASTTPAVTVEAEENCFTIKTPDAAYSGASASEAYARYCESLSVKHRNKLRMLTGIRVPGTNCIALYLGKTLNGIKVEDAGIYVSSRLSSEEALQCAQWLYERCEEQNKVVESKELQTVAEKDQIKEKERSELSPELNDLFSDEEFEPLRSALQKKGIMTLEQLKSISLWTFVANNHVFNADERQRLFKKVLQCVETVEAVSQDGLYHITTDSTEYTGITLAEAFAAFCRALVQKYPNIMRGLMKRKEPTTNSVVLHVSQGKGFVEVIRYSGYVNPNISPSDVIHFGEWLCAKCGDSDIPRNVSVPDRTVMIHQTDNADMNMTEQLDPSYHEPMNEVVKDAPAVEETREEEFRATNPITQTKTDKNIKTQIDFETSPDNLYHIKTTAGKDYTGGTLGDAFAAFCISLSLKYSHKFRNLVKLREPTSNTVVLFPNRYHDYIEIIKNTAYVRPNLSPSAALRFGEWLCVKCGDKDIPTSVTVPEWEANNEVKEPSDDIVVLTDNTLVENRPADTQVLNQSVTAEKEVDPQAELVLPVEGTETSNAVEDMHNMEQEACSVIDFNDIASVFFTRPVGYRYRTSFKRADNWQIMFGDICECLIKDYPDAFYRLRRNCLKQYSGRWIVDEKRLASLNVPRKIAEDYYVETKRAPTALIKILKQVLDECAIDYSDLVIYYSEKGKTEEKSAAQVVENQTQKAEELLENKTEGQKEHNTPEQQGKLSQDKSEFLNWLINSKGMNIADARDVLTHARAAEKYSESRQLGKMKLFSETPQDLIDTGSALISDRDFKRLDERSDHEYTTAIRLLAESKGFTWEREEKAKAQNNVCIIKVGDLEFPGGSPAEAFVYVCEYLGTAYPGRLRSKIGIAPARSTIAPLGYRRVRNALKVESVNAYVDPLLTESKVEAFAKWLYQLCGGEPETVRFISPNESQTQESSDEAGDGSSAEVITFVSDDTTQNSNEEHRVIDLQERENAPLTASTAMSEPVERHYARDDKENFYRWLQDNQHIAEGICRSYVSAIRSAENFAEEHNFTSRKLYTGDAAVARATADELFANAEFIRYDNEQHNRVRVAITQLLAYYDSSLTATKAKTARNDVVASSQTTEISSDLTPQERTYTEYFPKEEKPDVHRENKPVSYSIPEGPKATVPTHGSMVYHYNPAADRVCEAVEKADISGIKMEELATIARAPLSTVKDIVAQDESLVNLDGIVFSVEAFEDWDEGAEKLEAILEKLFDRNDGYVSATQLYEYVRMDMSMFLNDNDLEDQRKVYDLARHLFDKVHYHGKNYSFYGYTHISRGNTVVTSAMDVMKIYARECGDIFEESGLEDYMKRRGLKTGNLRGQMQLYSDSNPVFLLYDSNVFISVESMHIDANWYQAMNKAFKRLFDDLGDHIIYRDISDSWLMQLPALPGGRPWTKVLLQNLLRYQEYREKLNGVHTIYALSTQAGDTLHAMIVSGESDLESFPDAVAAFIVDEKIQNRQFTADSLRQMLVDRGLIGRSELLYTMPKALADDPRFAWDATGDNVTIKI